MVWRCYKNPTNSTRSLASIRLSERSNNTAVIHFTMCEQQRWQKNHMENEQIALKTSEKQLRHNYGLKLPINNLHTNLSSSLSSWPAMEKIDEVTWRSTAPTTFKNLAFDHDWPRSWPVRKVSQTWRKWMSNTQFDSVNLSSYCHVWICLMYGCRILPVHARQLLVLFRRPASDRFRCCKSPMDASLEKVCLKFQCL